MVHCLVNDINTLAFITISICGRRKSIGIKHILKDYMGRKNISIYSVFSLQYVLMVIIYGVLHSYPVTTQKPRVMTALVATSLKK